MKIIFKYAIKWRGATTVKMPLGAKVIHADAQGDELVLWAIVNPNTEVIEKTFEVFYTGEEIFSFEHPYSHISTIQSDGLVYHIFEITTP